MKPTSGDDETCYICYGLHYLNGKMRMNGEKAKCFGLSVRTDPNAVMIEKSKKLDMSLKPGITLLSFGKAHFTGKMHRLGTPPFCVGIQFSLVQHNTVQSNHGNPNPQTNSHRQPRVKDEEEVKLSPEEKLQKFCDSVVRSEKKFFRSLESTFTETVDDLPGKVFRSTGRFLRSTLNTGTMLTDYVLRSVGWK